MSETWIVEKDFTFEASHSLPDHDGKCARVHGHSYKVTVRVKAEQLAEKGPRKGFAGGVDYYDIAKAWEPLHEKLDHRDLNRVDHLGYPTVERLARFIFDELSDALPLIDEVTVCETPSARCTYRRPHA